MIELSEENKILYEKNVGLYLNYIEELKQNSILAKEMLLNYEFNPFPNDGTIEEKISFVAQFTPLLNYLIFFPDDEIIRKLKELRFSGKALKWFVNLEKITDEINRLEKIKGLYINPLMFLIGIESHLYNSFFISYVEDFELSKTYNKSETNIISLEYDNRIRRREYHKVKKQKAKMDDYEKLMNQLHDDFEELTKEDNGYSNKTFSELAKGNTKSYYNCLNTFKNQGISKNKVYLELFPLLKMIMKDDKMLTEDEFIISKDEKYDAVYKKYKISHVKQIIQ
jgi:hypothetical protein